MTCTVSRLDPIFIEIGGFPIHWYGVIIALGAFLGLFIATRESDRLGLEKDLMIDLVVFAIPIAILSARLYYVIFEWDRYANGPWWKVFAIWEGGIAIHGALIGSVITAIVFCRIRKVPFWLIADIAAPALILGQAIGRWGNFMNQEAYGRAISEATYNNFHQYLPNFIMDNMCIDGVMHHPTFLYESVWNILVFILLLVLRRYNPMRGEVFLSYILTYSIGRFFIEGLRMDSLYVLNTPIRTAQVLSIILILGAIGLMIYRRKSKSVDRHYDGKKVVR